MNDSDFEELQVKMAFLEDALSKLSDEYYQQQRELDTLKEQTVQLKNKVIGLQDNNNSVDFSHNEKPPHY